MLILGIYTKRTIFINLILILILLSSITFSYANESNKHNIIFVDDDNIEGPWMGSFEYPFHTIQDGINASNEGDTIFVFNGTYSSDLIIVKSISIIGENKNNTIISANSTDLSIYIRKANYIRLSNFTIKNKNGGNGEIFIFEANYTTIENNILTNNEYAITLFESHYNTISNNLFESRKEGRSIDLIDSSNNTLEKNIFINNQDIAIEISPRSNDNLIENNIITDTEFYGIYMFNSSRNIIQDNTIINNSGGIFSDCDDNSYIHNTFSNNRKGLELHYTNNNIVSYNTFSYNFISVDLTGSNTEITRNNFIQNFVDFEIINKSGIIISRNNFNNRRMSINFITTNKIKWDGNYWRNWQLNVPKPIFGLKPLLNVPLLIPTIEFDLNPAQEPFNI